MANRGLMLVAVLGAAVGLAACGRATDDQINQILGITPTPTPSAEQIVQATAEASATAAARAAALASPTAGAEAGAAVAMGDVVSGERQFTTWCAGCHGPGGMGPDILSAGSLGANVTTDRLLAIVHEGEGHTPPGKYSTTEISAKQVGDLAAYIRQQSGAGPETAEAAATTPVAVSAAPLGDAVSGERQFTTWCAGCHGPGGSGPDILSPGSLGASVTLEGMHALVRDGEGHTPPGPYKSTEISDKQIDDLATYILQESGGQ